jgi:hypothetical protein
MWEGRAQSRKRCGDVSAPQGLEALQRIACKLVLFDDALLIARSRGGALRAANRRIQSVYSSRFRCCASTSHRRRRKSHRLRCETPSADAVNGIGRRYTSKGIGRRCKRDRPTLYVKRHRPTPASGIRPPSAARSRAAARGSVGL